MKPLTILGLKNFRIFDNHNGFFGEFSAINILTGANSSGKSTIIKSLQLLKNSVNSGSFPYGLDLTEQEHLLGDFNNLLHIEKDRNINISLPISFLGRENLYISLDYLVSETDSYKAELRKMKIRDLTDNSELFSFEYRKATDAEKVEDAEALQQKKVNLAAEKKEAEERGEDGIFGFNFRASLLDYEDSLEAYVEWSINHGKLKQYLQECKPFYKKYLENKKSNQWLEQADSVAQEHRLPFVPSFVANSFKADLDLEKWTKFSANLTEGIVRGREKVGDYDFEPDDHFFPAPTIEDVFYRKSLDILAKKLIWKNDDGDESTFNVMVEAFKRSLTELTLRISSINYLATVREQNSRVYNSTLNSPFINLLKDYKPLQYDHGWFLNEYLTAFDIGHYLEIDHKRDYQLMTVRVVAKDRSKRDLVDFGYGIKQLILILIRISVLADKNKRIIREYDEYETEREVYDPSILLIEEPEAHLHPKWQSMLAKMFVEANKKFNIQFIIETHSEYLIRKLQTLVASPTKANSLNGEDVKIFYLRDKKNTDSTKKQVETTVIADDGSIDYQIFEKGFFDEADKLEMSLLNIQRDGFLKQFETLKVEKQEGDAKIEALEQIIDEYTSKADITFYLSLVEDRLNTVKLNPITVKYLASGQFILHTVDVSSDFSPVVMQYGRALENELKQLFVDVPTTSHWMLGPMQKELEKFMEGRSVHVKLEEQLENKFSDPRSLAIETIGDLRTPRNDAGHAGLIMTRTEAISYIRKVNTFLENWINQMK